jgi:SMI1 / KNR4 family (SUKH-1)
MNPLQIVLSDTLDALASSGFDARELVFAEPAAARDVDLLEADLGIQVPPAFKALLTHVSSHVEFRWFAPEKRTFPIPMHQCFSGDLHWSLDFVRQFNADKESWIRECFPDPSDAYDRIWHNKLAFYEVGNGDYLALDLNEQRRGQVVYLSHDDGQGHGHVLANDAIDLVQRWAPLACVGGEDWQWLPFKRDKEVALDPDGAQGNQWRQLLGLPPNMALQLTGFAGS